MISNTGSSDVSGTFRLTGYPATMTVPQPDAATGIIEFGTTKVIPIRVTLDTDLEKGTNLEIASLLDCGPYTVDKTYTISIGKIRESFEYQSFEIFPWNNGHDHPWIIKNEQAYEGLYSAQSAPIPTPTTFNWESKLSINVNVPHNDTMSFWWKVSSEKNYDFLYFNLNGTNLYKISGESDWAMNIIDLQEGINQLEWIYQTDGSVNNGSSCGWIDYITFPTSAFNRIDLKTGDIITPEPGKSYAQEIITAEVINFGTDTVNSFNLAYMINDENPVIENFTQKVVPGDTVVVAFQSNADLSGEGSYLISVYGLNNDDSYYGNDTTRLLVVNTAIIPLEYSSDEMTVMPNPFRSIFRIKLESTTSEPSDIEIIDNTGKVLWKEYLVLSAGENILTINPGSLPPGFYTLRVTGKKNKKVARIIKYD